jgi:hypothetical protein
MSPTIEFVLLWLYEILFLRTSASSITPNVSVHLSRNGFLVGGGYRDSFPHKPPQ